MLQARVAVRRGAAARGRLARREGRRWRRDGLGRAHRLREGRDRSGFRRFKVVQHGASGRGTQRQDAVVIAV